MKTSAGAEMERQEEDPPPKDQKYSKPPKARTLIGAAP
jgi:hypothetical protein